jgi:gamma-glutamyl hercynylcysteine S-oxide synthase
VASSETALNVQPDVVSRLGESRTRTDELFKVLAPNSFYDRPVAERHRLIFYLGHLEAFDGNLLNAALGIEPLHKTLNQLFAFGIDPIGGGLPTDAASDWPSIAEVEKYNRGVRAQLDERLSDVQSAATAAVLEGPLLNVAIEHRLMHAETLAYLFHNLPVQHKLPYDVTSPDPRPSPLQRQVTIPAGVATLGQQRGTPHSFGWDNEFDLHQVEVPSFSIDVFPVTNNEFLKFVRAGGYESDSHWRREDWEWKRQHGLEHPHFWIRNSSAPATDRETRWEYQGMFGRIPLPPAWPVYVSFAEAYAYSRWAGRTLPTEAQWQRAAYATRDSSESAYPWGNTRPDSTRGNFHHRSWEPTSVDAHPKGASALGVFDLLGNGWEWTSTPFGPLPGFEAFPFYKGYSADFFDGKHFVMKGGSPRTDSCMLRRSYRNWFQPHYPYIYSTFRCVEE